MANPLLTRKREIAAKIESTKGTSEHPLTGSEAKYLVIDPKLTLNFGTFQREFSRATLSRYGHIITNKPCSLDFSIEVRSSAAAGTADAWGVLLQGCGFKETNTPTVSDVYTPSSVWTEHQTLSMHLIIDGLGVTIKGAMGNVEFSASLGGVMLMNFSFQGVFVGAADDALNTITHETGVPGAFQGVAFSFNGNTADVCITNLSLNMNNDVQPRDCANDSGGIEHFMIVGRDAELTIDPELLLEAATTELDYYTLYEAATEVAITFDAASGSDISFSLPKCQIKSISDDERNGIAIAGLTLGVNRNSDTGDDEVVITKV